MLSLRPKTFTDGFPDAKPGDHVVLRPLTGKELDEARRASTAANLKVFASLGADAVTAMQAARTHAAAGASPATPALSSTYDYETVAQHGVVSIHEAGTPCDKAALPAALRDWCAEQILDMSVRPTPSA